MSDDFNGIFDDLNPSDFTVPDTTSAYDGPRLAAATWEEWLSHNVHGVVLAHCSAQPDSDEGMTGIAVLESVDAVRVFRPLDSREPLGEFIARLTAEAGLMGARRLFFAKPTHIGRVNRESAQSADVTDLANRAEAERTGQLQIGVLIYARELMPGGERTYLGAMLIDDDNRIGRLSPAPAGQTLRMFDGVLH